MPFGGRTYDRTLDRSRLAAQLAEVKRLMLAGEWRTLAQISAVVDAPQASVSARLRDLRKLKFGGYTVERRRVPGEDGLYEYRVVVPVVLL